MHPAISRQRGLSRNLREDGSTALRCFIDEGKLSLLSNPIARCFLIIPLQLAGSMRTLSLQRSTWFGTPTVPNGQLESACALPGPGVSTHWSCSGMIFPSGHCCYSAEVYFGLQSSPSRHAQGGPWYSSQICPVVHQTIFLNTILQVRCCCFWCLHNPLRAYLLAD